MSMTRRQFFARSGVAAAGTLLGPGLFASPLVGQALASTIGDRWLVVLFLDGGNDGINTVTPVSDGSHSHRADYDLNRGTGSGGINLSIAELAGTLVGNDPSTGAQLALHPGLAGLKALYDQGWLGVVQGCGYPAYSLSHELARMTWQTGNPQGESAGWVGRHLASSSGGYLPTDIPGVTIGKRVAPELRQSATSVLVVDQLKSFGFPYDDLSAAAGDIAAKRLAFNRLYSSWAATDLQDTKRFLGESGAATLASSEIYPQLHDLYLANRPGWSEQYAALDRSTARGLREIAKIIHGNQQGVAGVDARFFQLTNGGYDTHSNQGGANVDGQHYDLHREVGDSLKVFYDDLADMGLADKVLTLVWSEFSRRIPQNQSGTDHGSQGPMFVIGEAVNGGIYGNHPNLAALDEQENTVYSQVPGLFRSTDFRDVYGTILKHWLGMSGELIASEMLVPDVGHPGGYWTVPNFDMGFLP